MIKTGFASFLIKRFLLTEGAPLQQIGTLTLGWDYALVLTLKKHGYCASSTTLVYMYNYTPDVFCGPTNCQHCSMLFWVFTALMK